MEEALVSVVVVTKLHGEHCVANAAAGRRMGHLWAHAVTDHSNHDLFFSSTFY
jgi:hypothetical protein